jgi:hypothetical protein
MPALDNPHRERLPRGDSHGVNVWVSWGYEIHDVNVSARKWKRIRAGESVMVKSIGWYEGRSFECRWHIDLSAENTLVVSYGDDGADGFIGNISDATIEALSKRLKQCLPIYRTNKKDTPSPAALEQSRPGRLLAADKGIAMPQMK